MARPLYSPHDRSLTVLYADLERYAHEQREVFVGTAGSVLERTNASGFRDRDFPPMKAPGGYRIIVVGDSVTFGWLEREENLYPKVLERLLAQGAEGDPPCEVYNMAVFGYNAEQELETIRTKALPLQPDLIIIQWCLNDNKVGEDLGLWRHFNQTSLRTWDLLRLSG